MRAINLVQGNENCVCHLLKRGNDTVILLPIETLRSAKIKTDSAERAELSDFFVRPRRLLIPETLPGNVTAIRRTGPS